MDASLMSPISNCSLKAHELHCWYQLVSLNTFKNLNVLIDFFAQLA